MTRRRGHTEPIAIPDCALNEQGLGAQLARYRELGQHAVAVERVTGEVRVRFAGLLPLGLLGRTLDVERRCCPFVHADYDEHNQRLTLTVDTVDQDPRLDSRFDALTRPSAGAVRRD